ncbi:high-affinity zinc uptake system membrane protein ZnuB [mine drainage metagenome]|uniref:High-affinity zinc uptake system membrane protein ZnuB n=1 Tax=mine drainage metagenome TaxID=410659 RepID=A0A1J5SEA6_9ZZZZ
MNFESLNLSVLDISILGPAFLAGLLVLATHVPLGQQVLKRGIVFIDLAVAQIAALGVIAADAMGWEPQGLKVQIAAVCAALLGALLLTWTEKRWPEVQEALIGVFFVLAASAGILLLSNNPHGGEHLKDLLAGQILWVSMSQLIPVMLLTLTLLGIWFGFRQRIGRACFYVLFALAVTASVQLVGIYLVFSSLIIPALAVRNWPESRKLLGGYSVGVIAYVLGLALSAVFDLPSGAVIVWCLAFTSVIANLKVMSIKSAS